MKQFKIKEGLAQEPRINVTDIIQYMRSKPGYLIEAEHLKKGKKSVTKGKLCKYADKDKCFEFNSFTELIIFAVAETRVKYRDKLIEDRDRRIA